MTKEYVDKINSPMIVNNSFSALMAPINSVIPHTPRSFQIRTGPGNSEPELGNGGMTHGVGLGGIMAPHGDRLFFMHKLKNSLTGEYEIRIDIWNYNTLQLERVITLSDIAGDHHREVKGDKPAILRSATIMDTDHIMLGLFDGRALVVSVEEGKIIFERKIGYQVESICRFQGKLAVSTFPGEIEERNKHCGIKIYDIEDIVKNRVFNAERFIEGPDLPILPNRIMFSGDGSEIFCRGSILKDKSYENLVFVHDLKTDNVTTILRERDSDQNHWVSNQAPDGTYFIVSKTWLTFYSGGHQIINRRPRPEPWPGVNPNVLMCSDGKRAILLRNGVPTIFNLENDREEAVKSLGYIKSLTIGPHDNLIGIIGNNDTYDIVFLTMDDLTMVKRLNHTSNPGPEKIIASGFCATPHGEVYMGDRQGYVRVFNYELRQLSRKPTNYGQVRDMAENPFSKTAAMVTCPGAVMLYSGDYEKPEIYISKTDRKPVEPGSGYVRISFPTHKPGSLLMHKRTHEVTARIDDKRYLDCIHRATLCEVTDWVETKNHVRDKFFLESGTVAATELMGRALFLLENGDVVSIDPYEYETWEDIAGDKYLDLESPHASIVMRNVENPIGMARAPESGLIIWTNANVVFAQISKQFKLINSKSKEIQGVKNIKWDTANKRLMVAFSKHISFWTENLEEMVRLYLLPDGGHIIHAPYPEELAKGADGSHPGYFWAEGDIDHVFEVLDYDGNATNDENRRRQFLDQYMNEYMVRRAITDYQGFKRDLDHSRNSERVMGINLRLPA